MSASTTSCTALASMVCYYFKVSLYKYLSLYIYFAFLVYSDIKSCLAFVYPLLKEMLCVFSAIQIYPFCIINPLTLLISFFKGISTRMSIIGFAHMFSIAVLPIWLILAFMPDRILHKLLYSSLYHVCHLSLCSVKKNREYLPQFFQCHF